jgi:hypothetical protein
MTTHDDWMTIREAALAWGVSELTVRRRIKDGKLRSRLLDGKYYVQQANGASPPAPTASQPALESTATPAKDAPSPSAAHAERPAINLDALVAEHRRLAEQAGRAALLEEQLRSLQERYAQLQDGAVSLANRNGWLESKLDEREREIKLLEDSRPKPSFWQRLFGGG